MASPAEFPTVSVSGLPTDGLALLDVRENDEWAAGHAPEAKHVPLGDLPSRVDELAEFPGGKPVYVICRSGGRSARAAGWLNANGWDAVNVEGGMKSWHAEGRTVVGERPDIKPEIL